MKNKFWLDTNVKIKFDYIKRMDLINNILPENTITLTGKLMGEYSNSGTNFQQAMNFDNPKQPFLVIPNNTISSYVQGKIKVDVINQNSQTISTHSNIPLPDKEGIVLGLQNYILLTDDFKHIRKLEKSKNLTCVGGTGILIANIIKKVLTPNWAGRYYKIWQNVDLKWVLSDFSDFAKIYNNGENRLRIKEIFNLKDYA